MKFLKNIKRMWVSAYSTISSLFRRTTKDTTTTISTAGTALAGLVTVVCILCLLIAIAIASIPTGIFGLSTTEREVCKTQSSTMKDRVDKTFSQIVEQDNEEDKTAIT